MLRNIKSSPFNAKGDGIANDTGAIAQAIEWALDGDSIYFPSGKYVLLGAGDGGLQIAGRKSLAFIGDGHDKSIIVRAGSTNKWATFSGCRDVLVEGIAVDRAGLTNYGGWFFYSCLGVTVRNCRAFDSSPVLSPSHDLYSFVLGIGPTPSKYVLIEQCVIEDLQLEVDHSDQVLIQKNKVSRSRSTCSIGAFTQGKSFRNYDIGYNSIFEPMRVVMGIGALVVEIDPPTNNGCTVENIKIHHNRVMVASSVTPRVVQVGTGNLAQATTGNVFRNITVENNRFENLTNQIGIFCNNAPATGFVVDGLFVRNNLLFSLAGGARAIDVRQFRGGAVINNLMVGSWANPPVNAASLGGTTINGNVGFSLPRPVEELLSMSVGVE